MPVLGWIAVVAGAWLIASVIFGFGLARVFALFNARSRAFVLDERSEGLEFDAWASKPLTRAVAAQGTSRTSNARQRQVVRADPRDQ